MTNEEIKTFITHAIKQSKRDTGNDHPTLRYTIDGKELVGYLDLLCVLIGENK